MLNKNLKVITAYKNNNTEEKVKILKEIVSTSKDDLFDKNEFNYHDAGIKFNVIERYKINISKSDLIDSSFKYFKQFYDTITSEMYTELKVEIERLPIERFPIVYLIDDSYIDLSVYHIFHFIKDTKHILANIQTKKRYFYSTFKKEVIEKQINLMEKIKTEKFLFPKSEFDQNILQAKDKLLKHVNEHYNVVFAYNALFAQYNTKGIYQDQVIDETINDFQNSLNAIKVTKKDAIKSLAILLFHMYDKQHDTYDNELVVENILRIFFSDEIVEINKNKDIDHQYLDTFKVITKEFRKNVYISAMFDQIPVFGINRENKYFYYEKLTQQEVMRMYFEGVKFTYHDQDIAMTKMNYQIIEEQFLKYPHKVLYKRQYPEFFTMENPTALDIMVSFFEMMKKTAPDNLR